jgi:hypothetical protein
VLRLRDFGLLYPAQSSRKLRIPNKKEAGARCSGLVASNEAGGGGPASSGVIGRPGAEVFTSRVAVEADQEHLRLGCESLVQVQLTVARGCVVWIVNALGPVAVASQVTSMDTLTPGIPSHGPV